MCCAFCLKKMWSSDTYITVDVTRDKARVVRDDRGLLVAGWKLFAPPNGDGSE